MTNNSLQLGRNLRLIARLDIKGENLIKGIQLEGLRIIGPPNEYALKYYLQGVDELIYMDCVASLYGRNHLSDIISAATKNIFVPITVGGGIRSVDDAFNILRAGADKVAINTAAVSNPKLIENISREFGSQCMVLSVEAKKVSDNKWEVYTNNGREKTGLEVIDWVKKGIDLGAGEILLTSVDKEGTRKGFDTMLVKSVTEQSMVPVIASGGMGLPEDLLEVVNKGGASAIAMADILHYGRSNINEVRNTAKEAGFGVREYFVE
ncbi:imidazole glycerol phosphate synthase cyclase subunit [Nitrosomonadales bacterium]|nr:imidazole glycerol phosphate synthase cyclase subunit [Nitrosomonadales bacterium]